MDFDYPDGATPIDPDEAEELKLPHISTRQELDRWEQENILEAESWAFGRKHKEILSENFVRRLHKRMFGDVWKWAGEFRKSDKNIGIAWFNISAELQKLLQDVAVWVEYRSYPSDEMAAHFHHRLVAIHPFPNGNGRHARMMTDIFLVQALDRPRFTWGQGDLISAGDCRQRYIEALRAADRHDYQQLLEFVRS